MASDRGTYFATAASDEESASSASEEIHTWTPFGLRTRTIVGMAVGSVAVLSCLAFAAPTLLSPNQPPVEVPFGLSGGPGQSREAEDGAIDVALRSARLRSTSSTPKGRWLQLQGGNKIPVDEGEQIELDEAIPEGKCTEACHERSDCDYAITCGSSCYLKVNKAVDWWAETKSNPHCSAWIYTEETYFPPDKSLTKPSTSPTYTFYMYRTQAPETPRGDYPLENVNTASAAGVLWYLQHEMIPYCSHDGVYGDRRFGVTRIRRFKVTMKTPQPLLDKGMHFGSLCSFDSGECTGPHRHYRTHSGWDSKEDWDEYGFHVGCGNLGEYPHKDWRSGKRYHNAVWYSLPGSCPTMRYDTQSEQCEQDLPGGLCDEVTGQGNCTYSIENAGEIDIDELVGIKPRYASRKEFCQAGCHEGRKLIDPTGTIVPYIFDKDDNYDEEKEKGCTKWWADIWNPIENEWRLKKMHQKFQEKYPDMPTEESMPPPKCDYDRARFGWSV